MTTQATKAAHRSLLRKIFVDTYVRAEAEAEEFRGSSEGRRFDYGAMLVCVIVAFSLAVINYWGNFDYALDSLNSLGLEGAARTIKQSLTTFSNEKMAGWIWWVGVTVFFYFILPACFIRFALGKPLSGIGLRAKGALTDYHLYIAMFAVMIPVVLIASGLPEFQARYPFYPVAEGESLWPRFWQWQFFYFLQFFSLEFFFRGFIVHGLKPRFGFYSVFVMMVPYCMIHFRKPMLESFAAIIAGLLLGTLSLKSRSILPGVAIHYGVALTMDIAALWRKGLLWQ